MKNRSNPLLLGMVCFASLLSCGHHSDDCTEHIGQTIHRGDSVEEAQSKLKDCGFKTTLDTEKSTLYGDKLEEGIPISKRTQVEIRFDPKKRVTEVTVGGGFIGP